MILVFDTETTGLPLNYNASAEDLNNWPRIIQLAYSVYDQPEKEIKRFCKLIRPDGWNMPTGEFWVKNGFNQEKSLSEGVPIKEVLDEYTQDRLKCRFTVAHNMNFDSKIIRSEMIRAGISTEFKAEKVCTMMKTISFCNLPHKNGRKGKKFPTLTELHYKLFNTGFVGAHDAGNDVDACAKCFFELVKRGVISLK